MLFRGSLTPMFRGNHPTRVDEKGRLKVPADFKRRIDEVYGNQFFITSKDGLVAEIYPLQEWEKIEAKIAAISSFNPAKKKFLERVNYYGQMVDLDSQGRLLLPQILRETAKVTGDVDVFGRITYLEVVNHETFEQSLIASPWSAEDGLNLESHGV
jgi:MraZ protein